MKNIPLLAPYVEQAPFARTSYVADNAGNDAVSDILKKAINDVLTTKVTASEALKLAKEEFGR